MFGFSAKQKGPSVGVSLRIPASIILRATLNGSGGEWRETSLRVRGIDELQLQQLLTKNDAIELREIASWFDSAWLKPSGDDLSLLRTALNVMRVVPPLKLDVAAKLHAAVKKDIAALTSNLVQFLELQKQDFEIAPKTPGAVLHGTTVLTAFNDLLTAAQRADKFLGQRPPVLSSPWFSEAFWIATYLKMVGEKAGKKVGLTKAESPAIQLIRRALKRVGTGGQFSHSAIARAFSRSAALFKRDPWNV
jgi:hypothetical protein